MLLTMVSSGSAAGLAQHLAAGDGVGGVVVRLAFARRGPGESRVLDDQVVGAALEVVVGAEAEQRDGFAHRAVRLPACHHV